MFKKRGQGLSTSTLILIILGVLILVILILGFTIGWAKIFPFISPSNNVKDVADKCSLACNTNSRFDYCNVQREVKTEGAIEQLKKNEKGDKVSGVEFPREFKGTCNYLTNIDALGLDVCNLDCGEEYVYSDANYAIVACYGMGDQEKIRYKDADAKAVQVVCPLTIDPVSPAKKAEVGN